MLIVKAKPSHTLTPELESYAREKFARLAKFLPDPTTVEVVLSDERGPKGGNDKVTKVTIIRPREKNPIHLEEVSSDFRSSIDLARDRAERTVRKIRDKKRDFHHRVLGQTQRLFAETARQTAGIPGSIWRTIRKQLAKRGW